MQEGDVATEREACLTPVSRAGPQSSPFHPDHATNGLHRYTLQQDAFMSGAGSAANHDGPFRQVERLRQKAAKCFVRCAVDWGGRDAEPERIAMETGELRSGGLGLEMDGKDGAFSSVLYRRRHP